MAVERVGGTPETPEVREMGSSVSVFPEQTRQQQIQNAAEILVSDDSLLIDEEITQTPEEEQIPFDSNLVDFID